MVNVKNTTMSGENIFCKSTLATTEKATKLSLSTETWCIGGMSEVGLKLNVSNKHFQKAALRRLSRFLIVFLNTV